MNIEIIKVYADGSGDFTSLKTAIDANAQNLAANNKTLIFELSGILNHSGGFIDLASYTTDSSRRILVKAKDGEQTNGIPGGSTSLTTTTYLTVCRDKHITFDGLELTCNGSSPALHGSSNARVENCLVTGTVSALSESAGFYIDNSIVYNLSGIYLLRAKMHRTTLIANTVSGGFGGAIIARYADGPMTQSLIYNELSGGYDNYFQGNNAASDYNADSDNKAPGTNIYVVSQSDFVDYASLNFNLSPSSPLYTAGPNGEPVGAVLSSSISPPQLTEVTKSFAINFDLLQEVSKQHDVVLNLLEQKQKTHSISFDLLEQRLKQYQFKFDLLARQTLSHAFNLNFLQSQSVDFSFVFDLLESVTKGYTFNLDFFQQVNKSFSVNFDLLAQGQVTKSFAIVFDLMQQVEKNFNVEFDLLEQASANHNFKFDLLQQVSKDFVAKFDLYQQVNKQFNISLDMLAEVDKNFIFSFTFEDENGEKTPAHYIINVNNTLDFKRPVHQLDFTRNIHKITI